MSVKIRIVSDLDPKGLKEAERGLERLKDFSDKSFRAVAVGTGIAAAAFGKFALDSIRAASNLEESTNAVNVSFGKSAKAILEIGKNSAESLGLARNEFNEAAVRFSAFAERIAGVGNDTSGFIREVTQRAADFASVFNIEVAEALRVFQSGLAGEAEPLKRFGINLLESEVKAYALRAGIISVGESMTETEKVQARYGLLLESTSKTAGDFANTSEGLANSQRILKARFTDMQAEIGQALLPAFTNLFKTVADRVMPEFEKLGAFLRSPQGQKAISDLANTIADLTIKFINNIDGVIRTATSLATFVVGVKVATTAVQAATTAQLLFNTAVRANPYVLAATGLLAFVSAVTAFRNDSVAATQAARAQAQQITVLDSEIDNLTRSYQSGAISQEAYEAQLKAIQREQEYVAIATRGTAGELTRFNRISLSAVRKEMSATAELGQRLANNQRELYFAMRGMKAPEMGTAFRSPAEEVNNIAASGVSAFEQARERVRDLIRSSQKQLGEAQQTLIGAQVSARQTYAENILRIEKDFAGRLSNIIQQSQDRLRSAYRSAVEENISALFDRSEDKSVEGLVKSLSDKLAGSRRLLENSAQLASQGFSQTFIEQIVGAGTATGNELASAILNSTPETKSELQKLFSALETEAAFGMDSLSKEIYEKQGLATTELKILYTNTQGELTQALLDQQTQLDNSLRAANQAFIDSVAKIKANLAEQLADMKNQFGGMERIIDQFNAKLDQLIAKSRQAQLIGNTPAPSVVSAKPETIVFNPIPQPVSRTPVVQTQPVINVNVKTDSTQSTSMVGKNVASAINKYVRNGGGLQVRTQVFAI